MLKGFTVFMKYDILFTLTLVHLKYEERRDIRVTTVKQVLMCGEMYEYNHRHRQ